MDRTFAIKNGSIANRPAHRPPGAPSFGPKKDPFSCDAVLEQFQRLQKAVIDASSIIYIKKAGFLDVVAPVVALYTPVEILRETGYPDLPVHAVHAPVFSVANDDKLIALALSHGWPVISEDRKVLRRAGQKGLSFFNALMILHFLLFKKEMTLERHGACCQRLKEFAWYGPAVYDVADAVYHKIATGL